MAATHRIKRVKREKRPATVYQYQQEGRYFAQVSEDLKEAAAEEMIELGAGDVRPEFSGIYFKADTPTLYRLNYQTRLLSRCLAPLMSFACPNADALYQRARQIPWEELFTERNTFAIRANVSDSAMSHSKFAALRLKDAIADHFRAKIGRRPNVSVQNPDILLNLHIRNDKAVISLDLSGGALHRRGYREETVTAPMQETVAAAIVRFSEWDGSVPFYDPMCGSGTLLCEALMRYCRVPAGIFRRRFGFELLPDFDGAAWESVKKEAEANIRELPQGLIAGSDVSAEAVDATLTNLMGLHFGNRVGVAKADFRELPALEGHLIAVNPPYGIRMGADDNLDALYKDLGDFLKHKCKGATTFIYFGDRNYIKNIGLRSTWKKPIKAGGLDGRLVKYELY